ncbi:MAG: DUF423 domain-containing protein [Weeksellaceae bacterium]
MRRIVLAVGSFYGMLSVILGAFGAHAFKEILSAEKIVSFETGVRYQLFHAVLLIVLGLAMKFENGLEKYAARCLMIGAFVFPVSIYFLSFAEHWGVNLKWLGPITPLGGLFMIIGWFLLFLNFLKNPIFKK